jgi:hypothetical protein
MLLNGKTLYHLKSFSNYDYSLKMFNSASLIFSMEPPSLFSAHRKYFILTDIHAFVNNDLPDIISFPKTTSFSATILEISSWHYFLEFELLAARSCF